MNQRPRRSEARLARRASEQLRLQEKSARLKIRPDNNPRPRFKVNPGSIYGQLMTWTIERADVEGNWSWDQPRQWTEVEWQEVILPKLQSFSGLTWSELCNAVTGSGHHSHHSMETDIICEEAQYRLVELDMYADSIFRFRLSNKRRLWGFRLATNFQIIWYDPEHNIYPVD